VVAVQRTGHIRWLMHRAYVARDVIVDGRCASLAALYRRVTASPGWSVPLCAPSLSASGSAAAHAVHITAVPALAVLAKLCGASQLYRIIDCAHAPFAEP
jgi:hypothetical protein